MPPIKMYSTAYCPFCVRAERLLNTKGVTEIDKIRVDLDPSLRAEMMQMTGRRMERSERLSDTINRFASSANTCAE